MATDPTRSAVIPLDVAAYIAARATAPDQVLIDLQARTAALGRAARMQISADEGALLTLLTRLARATSAVEVGTFTGFSSICIARGLAPGGRLLCCDVSEEYTAIAREAWAAAGLDDRIELRIAPAIETLGALPAEPTIDLAFIDADKGGYASYYGELVPRVRPGGLLLVDNTLWSGSVVDPSATDDDTMHIKSFNDLVAADERVESYLLPIGDGLTLIRKR
ncbi:MAG: class I SAM-dependent methyltransferase [Ilumatobacteraceae bacterium]